MIRKSAVDTEECCRYGRVLSIRKSAVDTEECCRYGRVLLIRKSAVDTEACANSETWGWTADFKSPDLRQSTITVRDFGDAQVLLNPSKSKELMSDFLRVTDSLVFVYFDRCCFQATPLSRPQRGNRSMLRTNRMLLFRRTHLVRP